jgi:hypothetical protein
MGRHLSSSNPYGAVVLTTNKARPIRPPTMPDWEPDRQVLFEQGTEEEMRNVRGRVEQQSRGSKSA